ncbi:MAG: hypothetical protein ABFR33_09780 [Verrucomicrobiota bacterium]
MKKSIITMLGAFIAVSAMAAQNNDIYITTTNGVIKLIRPDYVGGGMTNLASHAGDGSSATAVAIQSDGDVIYTTASGTIYRMDQDLVFQQNLGGFPSLVSTAVLSDDSVIAGDTNSVVYKRTPTLGFVGSFSGNGEFNDLAVQSDDDVIAITGTDGGGNGFIYRLNSNLVVQTSRSSMGDLLSVGVQSDDEVAWGRTSGLMRLGDKDTLADLSSNSIGLFKALAVLSDDRIVAIRSKQVVMYSADFTLLYSNYDNALGDLSAVAVMSDDKIVIANTGGEMWVLNPTTLGGVSYTTGLGAVTDIAVAQFVEPTKPATILSTTMIDAGGLGTFMEIVIDAPSVATNYHPEHTIDLPGNSWTNVPHTDAIGNTLYITNLGYSTASDVTNEVIYLQTTNSAEFFKIIGEQP